MKFQTFLAATVLGTALVLSACTGADTLAGDTPLPADPMPPTADFEALTTSGTAPLLVMFSDLSVGATTWQWDFGDGRVSGEQNPAHTYAAGGDYTVRLTVANTDGSDVMTKVDLVTAMDAVVDPSFESQTPGAEPTTPWVPFPGNAASTTAHVVRSSQDGGDTGMPSAGTQWLALSTQGTNDVAPPVAAEAGGLLKTNGVATGTGAAGVSQTLRYSATHPVLQLEASFINGEGGIEDEFNDWMSIQIGDGLTTELLYFRNTHSGSIGVSALTGNPITPIETVTANLAELFPESTQMTEFTLTVQVANLGDGSVNSTGYIDNLRFVEASDAPLSAAFLVSQRTGGVGTNFRFEDASAGTPKTYIWDFGDGIASTQQEPEHVYAEEGMYDVTLRVVSTGSSDLASSSVVVDDSACEAALFSVVSGTPDCSTTGDAVTFQNDSFMTTPTFGETYTWNFGDGTAPLVDDSKLVLHTFTTAGLRNVTLTVSNGPCFSDAPVPPDQLVDSRSIQIVDAPTTGALSISVVENDVAFTPSGFTDAAAFKGETVSFTASNSNANTGTLTYSWSFGDGQVGTGSFDTNVYNSTGNKTVTLTATNCAGDSAQRQVTVKVVQDWTGVYSAMSGCSATSCHGGSGTAAGTVLFMPSANKTTAHTNLRNVNMKNNVPFTKRVRITAFTDNASNSGLVWALTNNVNGQGQMASNCGCMNTAGEVQDLRDWINFGSPNN